MLRMATGSEALRQEDVEAADRAFEVHRAAINARFDQVRSLRDVKFGNEDEPKKVYWQEVCWSVAKWGGIIVFWVIFAAGINARNAESKTAEQVKADAQFVDHANYRAQFGPTPVDLVDDKIAARARR